MKKIRNATPSPVKFVAFHELLFSNFYEFPPLIELDTLKKVARSDTFSLHAFSRDEKKLLTFPDKTFLP